jgi:hypothetical protein
VSYCQFFNTRAGCRRKNLCGFVHDQNAVPSLSTQTGEGNSERNNNNKLNYNNNNFVQPERKIRNNNNNQSQQQSNPGRGALCHFYNKEGGCSAGNQCGYVHKIIQRNVTICHFFNTEKGCQAQNCGFVHQ